MMHRGGAKDISPDERIAVGHHMMAASCESLLRMLYPDLYVLHDPNGPWGLEQQDGAVRGEALWDCSCREALRDFSHTCTCCMTQASPGARHCGIVVTERHSGIVKRPVGATRAQQALEPRATGPSSVWGGAVRLWSESGTVGW